MALSKDLLDILCCPLCKGDLAEQGERLHCRRAECGLRFDVKEGIPVMLIEEADRSCPKCSKPRDWKGDALSCPACGAVFNAGKK